MEFFLIASAHFLALLSPGPDFFLIMQASLRLPLRYCLAVCGGISCANGMYLLSAVLGLEIIKDTAWLMSVLTYAGAVYLMFLGTMLLRTGRRLSVKDEAGAFLHTHSLARQFVIGFMSGILNPKNALFYLSLFTVMVSDQTSLETRFFYALWMMSVVFVWDAFIVLVIGQSWVKNYIGRVVFYVEKLAGVALVLFGVMLPFF